jgi:isocitrate lyase
MLEKKDLLMPSAHSNRFDGIRRDYTAADVDRLSGSSRIEYSLARYGAERLWGLLHERPFVRTLSALTGNQAMQQVKAGLEAIYFSGWQVAADANNCGTRGVPLFVEEVTRLLLERGEEGGALNRSIVRPRRNVDADREVLFSP